MPQAELASQKAKSLVSPTGYNEPQPTFLFLVTFKTRDSSPKLPYQLTKIMFA